MTTLKKGTEPNQIELLVDDVEIKPHSNVNNGIVEAGIVVKIKKYNLENILCQMLDEYGEKELIKRIKNLQSINLLINFKNKTK